MFDTEEEAGIAYNNKANELYGHFAALNVITKENDDTVKLMHYKKYFRVLCELLDEHQ
jgi:hypothetical protein